MAAALRTAWERGDLAQKDAERDLGIHQSQFSKLVNGQFKEARGHAARLYEYSNRKRAAPPAAPGEPVDVQALLATLTARLMHAWDGTEEGARALEAILDGARRLRATRPPSA
jgi:hypothetical protein